MLLFDIVPYCGMMQVSDWGVRKGLHKAMLTEEQFEELQYRIQDVKPKYTRTPHFNPYYPLQKIASCGICGGIKRITGSTGCNGHGGKPERYYCMDCKKYQQRAKMHSGLDKLLMRVYLPSENKKMLVEALKIVWKEKEGDGEGAISALDTRKQELMDTKSRLVHALRIPQLISVLISKRRSAR